jgi:hypothetical protein
MKHHNKNIQYKLKTTQRIFIILIYNKNEFC